MSDARENFEDAIAEALTRRNTESATFDCAADVQAVLDVIKEAGGELWVPVKGSDAEAGQIWRRRSGSGNLSTAYHFAGNAGSRVRPDDIVYINVLDEQS